MRDLPTYYAWYEITLLECGPHKADVIKLLRLYNYLNLRECWRLVENLAQAPVKVCVGDRLKADRCRTEFEALGAKVTMEHRYPVIDGPGIYEG